MNTMLEYIDTLLYYRQGEITLAAWFIEGNKSIRLSEAWIDSKKAFNGVLHLSWSMTHMT